MKFVQLSAALKEGLSNAYLIEGEDAYFRTCAADAVRAACKIAQPALNDVRCEGEALKGDRLSAFLSELCTAPFLDEKRVVRAYEFYPSEREWGALERYLQAPCASTVLLIVNAAKKIDAKRKKHFTVVDCAKEEEPVLSKWVFGVARKEGIAIDSEAAAMLVRYCNSDAARMKLELAKLKLLLGHGGRITREVVEEQVAKDVEYKIYELTQAASRGNSAVFFEILSDLLEKGSDENAVIAALASHYRTLAEISVMRGTDAEIGEALGIKPYAVKKQREIAVRLGPRAQEIYLALYDLSADMRGGSCSKRGALDCAISKIFFGN